MIDLIRKRHDGPAWIVIEEAGNSTGYHTSRHADAVAIGLWPSRGYEIHGYELKASRGDVQKELNDPSKADAVGKYCDYWWLVVEDLKIIDGLVIPETWGILYPKNRVLRVHRKAPKREATPVTRGFIAALIRRVCEGWVPKSVHDEYKAKAMEQAKAEIERDNKWKRDSAVHDLDTLRATVKRFEEHSGVEITQRYGESAPMPLSSWEIDRIGDAVKLVREARELRGVHYHHGGINGEAIEIVQNELQSIERSIANHEHAIASRRAGALSVRTLLERLKAEAGPATNGVVPLLEDADA